MEQQDIAWLAARPAVVGRVIKVGGDPFKVVEAYKMARRLMDENGVAGWDLRVGTANEQCSFRYHYAPGTKQWDGKPGWIMISGPLMSLWTVEQQLRIILHEIAHCQVPDAGHGPEWRAACRRLGMVPKRLWGSDGERRIEDFPWTGSCPGGHPHKRRRRPARTLSCTLCWPVFDDRYTIVWRKEQGE